MIILSLMVLAFICISMAFTSIQSKRIDDYIKEIEKEVLDEFKITN